MPAIQLSARLAELFSSAVITGYYDTARESVRPYLGEALFPNARTSGMELKSISGKAGPPVTLRASEFDTLATVRPRIPFKAMSNEMPFFRESMRIGEKERQELRIALEAGDQYARHIIDKIYDDQFHLLLGADAAVERMRKMLLSTGCIRTVMDGVPMDYDYGFDMTTQVNTLLGGKWDDPDTSDPITDLLNALEAARLGSARAIMTTATYRQMLKSKSLLELKYPGITSHIRLLSSDAAAIIEDATKVTMTVIGPEENTYRERVDGPDLTMFPDGVVTLLPSTGAVGATYYGVTPEESDLLGEEDVDVTVTAAGVSVVSEVHPHPVNHETRVSQIALPVMDRMDQMYILHVYTPKAEEPSAS